MERTKRIGGRWGGGGGIRELIVKEEGEERRFGVEMGFLYFSGSIFHFSNCAISKLHYILR